MIMFIHFFCLCPLSLAIKLNFNISKVAYYDIIFSGFVKMTIAVFSCSRRNRVLRNNLTISMVIPEMILK